MNENQRIVLYVPAKIKTKYEFFPGIGVSEMIIATIVFTISSIIAYTYYKLFGNPTVAAVFAMILTTLAIFLVIKDENGLCVMDQMKNLIRFQAEQKKYPYRYMPEWGEEE